MEFIEFLCDLSRTQTKVSVIPVRTPFFFLFQWKMTHVQRNAADSLKIAYTYNIS